MAPVGRYAHNQEVEKMKNVLAAVSIICGFLISVYVSLTGGSPLLWLSLVLLLVVPMVLASWGDTPDR